ncbi:MAG TPA: tannase/feruloyl esterase family alpha/beta hydrolase [Steroidobacteraceae bacterium]|jgi:feruloyl esterase|nr:tannase/feruloyl esterase family alpha/beta hydrolase [Steroidobacteraceae bacterium]
MTDALRICALIAAGLVTARANAATTRLAADCTSLEGFMIPAAAIGLPTGGAIVESAVTVTGSRPGNVAGDYCKVTGFIRNATASMAVFEFEVNLPITWNGRALQMGGGGYDGALVDALGPYTLQPRGEDTPLERGYVTLGSNGGHQGGRGFDGRFGLDDEALLNYGKESVKKTHDVAMAIIHRAYGRAPQRFYFIGGSQGGHEALDAAARYPDDYDGVVANFPAYDVTMLHLGSWNVGRALYADGGAGWMDAAHVKLLTDAVMATCDGLDGVKDGIISNVAACDAAFQVKTLRCRGAAAGQNCLSDAQLKAIAAITSDYNPGFSVAGMDTFPKWALLEGSRFAGPSNFGSVTQPSNPLSGKEPLLYSAGDATIKYIITRDPKFDTLRFDPKRYQARIARVASIMDVTDQSLERFRAKGGKVIITHGTADELITPYNSIAYYKRQLTDFGQQRLHGFLRFYLIPGFSHGFGAFNAKFDALPALEQWVENGKAPADLVATDGNPDAHRTRPLCEYPLYPRFTGAPGTENSAGSFTCIVK